MELNTPLSISDYTDIVLSYYIWYETGGEYPDADECTFWVNDGLYSYLISSHYGLSCSWQYKSIPIIDADNWNELGLLIGFFTPYNSVVYEEGVYLDKIRITGVEPDKPNLTFATPFGWDGEIVVSHDSCTGKIPDTLFSGETAYINWGLKNSGAAPSDFFYVNVYIDDELYCDAFNPGLDINAVDSFYYNVQHVFGPGEHTIAVEIDCDDDILETDETDNIQTESFSFVVAAPNLAFYTPYDWDTSVVVSQWPQERYSSITFYAGDPAYVHWASINNGYAPTVGHSTNLYIDNILEKSWYNPGMQPGWTQIEDRTDIYLNAGWHQIKVELDAYGEVSEISENDNIYIDQQRYWSEALLYVSGVVEYQYRETLPAEYRLIKGYKVELWDYDIASDVPRIKLAEKRTNDDGYFCFNPELNVDNDMTRLDIMVRVYADNDTVFVTTDTLGLDSCLFSTNYVENVPSGEYIWDFDPYNGFYERVTASPTESGPFYVADVLRDNYRRWLALRPGDPGITHAVVNEDITSCYKPSSDIICICSGINVEEFLPDVFDEDVIEQEFGHRLEHIFGFFDVGGGMHGWSMATYAEKAANEAFSYWWAAHNNNSSVFYDSYNNFFDTLWWNMENGGYGHSGLLRNDTTGSANSLDSSTEGTVACILWDILDDTPGEDFSGSEDWLIIDLPHHPDGIGDNLAADTACFFGTLLDKALSMYGPETIGGFWEYWFEAPSYGNLQEMIDIWYEHGIDLNVLCGDANTDGLLNVADAVYLINYIFKEGPAPDPLCIGNVNGDELTNVGDAVYMIQYIFQDGAAPIPGCCL